MVLLIPFFLLKRADIILTSSSSVKERTVSISSILISLRRFSSSPSPFMTMASFSSFAINSARSEFFSIILILGLFSFSSSILARSKPIFPAPIIKIVFANFSSLPKIDKVLSTCFEFVKI